MKTIQKVLERIGLDGDSTILRWGISVVAVVGLAWVAAYLARRVLLRAVKGLATRTEISWDDRLVEAKVFERLASLAPVVVLYLGTPLLIPEDGLLREGLQRVILALGLLVGIRVIDALLSFLSSIAQESAAFRDKPVRSTVQVFKLLVWMFGMIVLIGVLIGKSPVALLAGLGALSAVLLLVFKDPIMGLVASVQIGALDLVRKGDWIEVPQYGADGDVEEISLTTIKVRNWDKTVSTIPTYALVSDSFRNWRGMTESGGRRIKRSLRLDLSSIHFLQSEERQRLEKIQVLGPFLKERDVEIEAYNQTSGADVLSPANGRRMTNVGTFRAYMELWLRAHPEVHDDMTFLVRQLPSDEFGLPIEVYFFSREQRWAVYESIMSDIFDHFFAVLPEFGLRSYQRPAGSDFQSSETDPVAASSRSSG